MTKCGIQVHDNPGHEYLTYTLPTGWKMVDDSQRRDLPNFHIVDNEEMVRFSIHGGWKGTYDNELHLICVAEPYKFEQRHEEVIPSETNTVDVVGKLAEAFDPLHRPANS